MDWLLYDRDLRHERVECCRKSEILIEPQRMKMKKVLMPGIKFPKRKINNVSRHSQ